jgi:hypothetical protein
MSTDTTVSPLRCENAACAHTAIAYNSLYGDLFVKLSASSFLNP